ncbi:MAG: hypothetical protein E7487_08330 [Ruminococcaceae bacterium]|nr:hypothetical protein [Oscillospiraceae bacterium]
MKKLLAMLLAVLMIVTLFAGCADGTSDQSSESKTESSKPAEDKKDDEAAEDEEPVEDNLPGPAYTGSKDPITFKLLMGQWTTWDEPMTADPLGQWLIEKTGVTIEAELITGEAEEKYALVLATKDYPDFAAWPGDAMALQYIAEGAFVAYDEYLDKLPNVVSRYGDLIGGLYDIDTQHLYRISQWSMGNSFSLQQGLNLRSDVMKEAFGENSLLEAGWHTLSEYEDAMVKWKEENPTNADGATTYPFTTKGVDFLVIFSQLWGIAPFYDTDDEIGVGYYYTHPDMEEVLATLNRWYNEGILDPEFAINKKENMQSKLSTGISIASVYHHSELTEVNKALSEQDPDLFIYSHPQIHADGYEPLYQKYSPIGSGGLVTFTTCQDLDRALDWINYMNDAEVMFYLCNGLPGEEGFWSYDDNGMVVLNEENIKGTPELWDRFRAVGGYKYIWMLSEGTDTRFPAYEGDYFAPIHGQISEIKIEEYGRYHFWDPEVDNLYTMDQFQGIEPSPDTEEGIIKTEIDDVWTYALPEIIMAKDEATARQLFQDMVEEMEDLGLSKWLSVVAPKYEVKKEILGIE